MMNSPFESDSALRNPLVSSFRTSTLAPATNAAEGSVVIPTSVAVEVCAPRRESVAHTSISAASLMIIFLSALVT